LHETRPQRSRISTIYMNNRKNKRRRPTDEGSYVCPTCGERIIIPVDPSAGAEQHYVEDCPVCCNPNVIRVEFFDDGDPPRVWADAE
jgi:ribosomal protein L37AE/L43A